MKKCIAILLCLCTLSITAFASDSQPDYMAEYEAQYGKAPVAADFKTDAEYVAASNVWLAGFETFVTRRAAEEEQKRSAEEEAVRIAAEEEAAEQAPATLPNTFESAGTSHVNSSSHADTSVDTGLSDKYPVGSRVDSAGNVYSPDGTLLSPGTTPAYAPASGPDENASLLPDELADPDNLSAVTDPDTLAVIAGLVSDIATDPPTWYVDDLRPADPPVEVLTGLKSLVTSIFGEYTPVTTTSVISETVGNDTHQYLVETVAPGAAGVDYEWVAGVLLFAIMLYCLMKLLGGVLK